MAKKPTAAKPNFASFTKAELIRTIKTLDRRQTQLLNQIAKLQSELQTERDGGMVAKLDAIVRQRKTPPAEAISPTYDPGQPALYDVAGNRVVFPWEK